MIKQTKGDQDDLRGGGRGGGERRRKEEEPVNEEPVKMNQWRTRKEKVKKSDKDIEDEYGLNEPHDEEGRMGARKMFGLGDPTVYARLPARTLPRPQEQEEDEEDIEDFKRSGDRQSC